MKNTVLVVLALALVGFASAAGCVSTLEDPVSPEGVWLVPGVPDLALVITPDETYVALVSGTAVSGTYTAEKNNLTFLEPEEIILSEDSAKLFAMLADVTSFAVVDGKLILSDGNGEDTVFVSSIVGTWTGENGVRLTFNGDWTFSGKGPVNSFFGTYAYEADSLVITLEGITNSAGSKEDMEAEEKLLEALFDARDFIIEGNKLTFRDAAYPKTGNALLTLTATDIGTYMNQYGDILVLNADGTFSGQAPINSFTGTYEIADGVLVLQNFSMTRMAGDEDSTRHEAAFLENLAAENFTFTTGQFLIGSGENGEVIHAFFRV